MKGLDGKGLQINSSVLVPYLPEAEPEKMIWVQTIDLGCIFVSVVQETEPIGDEVDE